jgi:hypothetical protein
MIEAVYRTRVWTGRVVDCCQELGIGGRGKGLELDPDLQTLQRRQSRRQIRDRFSIRQPVAANLLELEIGNAPQTREAGIVVNHQAAILRRVDIQLDAVRAQSSSFPKGLQAVLAAMPRSPAMG